MSSHQTASGEAALFRACAGPFLVFLAFSLLLFVADGSWQWNHPSAPWYQRAPEMLIYPLQVVGCAAYIWYIRKGIRWSASLKSCLLGVFAGVVGISAWLIPYVAGWIPNEGGFEPELIFGENSAAIVIEYMFRFARAALIVPIVEELFWRGYLMRWCINRDFPQNVPLGQGSWLSYIIVTAAFMFAHNPVDYAGAFVYGSIAYLLVVRTKCLLPVILMHAVANLIMGICAIALALPQLW